MQLIVENEREWRQYMISKVDSIEKELHTFKIKVLGFAITFGGGAGISASWIKELFTN